MARASFMSGLFGALALCCAVPAMADGFPGLSKADLDAIDRQIDAAFEKCPCLAEQFFVTVERVIPKTGNNPFDPQNPLGPQVATGVIPEQPRTCSTPQPPSESQTLSCPPGQSGSILQNRVYSCSGTAWTPGPWVTAGNTCAALPLACTGSAPPPESQTVACPAGQVGSMQQARSYSCANGAWTAGAWLTVSSNCSAPPSGCATHYSSGNYACSGTCGVANVALAVTPGSLTMIANPFGANSNVTIACSGAAGQPQSSNLIILGLPGHTCGLNATGMTAFGLACRNNSGGACASACSR